MKATIVTLGGTPEPMKVISESFDEQTFGKVNEENDWVNGIIHKFYTEVLKHFDGDDMSYFDDGEDEDEARQNFADEALASLSDEDLGDWLDYHAYFDGFDGDTFSNMSAKRRARIAQRRQDHLDKMAYKREKATERIETRNEKKSARQAGRQDRKLARKAAKQAVRATRQQGRLQRKQSKAAAKYQRKMTRKGEDTSNPPDEMTDGTAANDAGTADVPMDDGSQPAPDASADMMATDDSGADQTADAGSFGEDAPPEMDADNSGEDGGEEYQPGEDVQTEDDGSGDDGSGFNGLDAENMNGDLFASEIMAEAAGPRKPRMHKGKGKHKGMHKGMHKKGMHPPMKGRHAMMKPMHATTAKVPAPQGGILTVKYPKGAATIEEGYYDKTGTWVATNKNMSQTDSQIQNIGKPNPSVMSSFDGDDMSYFDASSIESHWKQIAIGVGVAVAAIYLAKKYNVFSK